MTVYRATVLFLTAGMLVLHVLEWKTAAVLAPALGPCSGGSTWAQKLRPALRSEATYYLLVLPLLGTVSNTLVGRLMLVSAVYHWAGLALIERSGQMGAVWRGGILAIALLDLGEMVVLACFCRILFNSLTR